ncbi:MULTISPECIES: hypothetical protein [Azotobacter]|nr:hypothetical protein [Azotobacter vinelandii]WKN20392.1 hypothetical protein AVAEIV_003358 [Azotobacter vinelandii]
MMHHYMVGTTHLGLGHYEDTVRLSVLNPDKCYTVVSVTKARAWPAALTVGSDSNLTSRINMNHITKLSQFIMRALYCLISLLLTLISLAIMYVAIHDVWVSLHERVLLVSALLDAIGLIVIGMAVFDVSKFILEEEVIRGGELKSHTTERRTLLKFLVIISIAVSLEALVFIFDAGKKDITMLVYPTFLLIAAVMLIVSLGIYQKLSQDEDQ